MANFLIKIALVISLMALGAVASHFGLDTPCLNGFVY